MIIEDDWGVSAHALVRGSVQRTDGPYRNGTIVLVCGLDSPSDFVQFGDTDADGRYQVELDVPGPFSFAVEEHDWKVTCSVRAPANRPPFASADTVIALAATDAPRPVTELHLHESWGASALSSR